MPSLTPPSDSVAVPPAYGYVEAMAYEADALRIEGWILDLAGPFDTLTARNLTDGRPVQIEPRERPDLAHAATFVPDSHRGGFALQAPVAMPWPGTIDIEVVGTRGGRPAGAMRIDVHCAVQPQTYPPDDVMRRASGSAAQHYWRATGIKAANDFLRILGKHTDLARARTFFEWGCGSGRLTKHLIDRLPHARVSGADIDVEAVQWAGANLGGTFTPCKTEPPLPYPDNSFDALCALSVCTHLTERHQDAWLPELRRVLRPGGLCALTTHGEFAARWIFHRPGEYERVMASGFFDGLADHNLTHVASGDYYRSTFQTREWTTRRWGQWFEVVDFVQAGINNFQDVFVLRRQA
ncbi:MAG: class I SAM-dependent methyltransferase [Planctomycetota bacterium]